jgi:hypothetical protein
MGRETDEMMADVACRLPKRDAHRFSCATLVTAEPGPLTSGFQRFENWPRRSRQCDARGATGIEPRHRGPAHKASHGVQVRITSRTQNVVSSSVAPKPGQYTNSTFAQIANAVTQPLDVKCQVIGHPPGADKIFLRVSEHVSQSAFEFIEGLAGMRHLFIVDDANGN